VNNRRSNSIRVILLIAFGIFFYSIGFAKEFNKEMFDLRDKLLDGSTIEITAQKSEVTGTFAKFYCGGRLNEINAVPKYFIFFIKININKSEFFVPMSSLSRLYNPKNIILKKMDNNKFEIIVEGDSAGIGINAGTEYLATFDFYYNQHLEFIKRKWILLDCPKAAEETTYSWCEYSDK
jgi:hypothetical protein